MALFIPARIFAFWNNDFAAGIGFPAHFGVERFVTARVAAGEALPLPALIA